MTNEPIAKPKTIGSILILTFPPENKVIQSNVRYKNQVKKVWLLSVVSFMTPTMIGV
jgi:hypothetical protein